MRIEKKVLNDALRVLGKVVCQEVMQRKYMIKYRGTVVAFTCLEYLLIYCEMLRVEQL